MRINNGTHLNDKELLEGLKNGDRASLTFIYDEMFPKVKFWILQNKGTVDDAYDIFQEVMECILLNVDQVYKSFGGMVMFMAKNKWIDKIRKDKTRTKVRNEVPNRHLYENDVEKELIEKESEYTKFQLLENTFSQLSEICQQVMTMIREGKKVNEIVVTLNFKSTNTLYRRKAACVERWSTLIKNNTNYKFCYE